MVNEQTVLGFLAADAVLRPVGPGRFAANFRVGATHEFFANGARCSHTEWFDVAAFAPGADPDTGEEKTGFWPHWSRSLVKGALVHVKGRTITREVLIRGEPTQKRQVVVESVDDLKILPFTPQRKHEDVDERREEVPAEATPAAPPPEPARRAAPPPVRNPGQARRPASADRGDALRDLPS